MEDDDTADDADSLVRKIASAPPIAPPVAVTSAPASESREEPVPDPGVADARAFALVHAGLHFAEPDAEAAYIASRVTKLLRPVKIVSIFFAVVNAFLLVLEARHESADVASHNVWQHVGALVFSIGGIAATYSPWARRHFFALYLGALLTGPVMAAISYAGLPAESYRGQGIVGSEQIFFVVATLVLANLGFVRSVIASVAFAAVFQYVLVHVPRSASEARSLAVLFYLITAACLVANFFADRRDRRLFMNEQLLARERERSEHALRRDVADLSGELEHQRTRSLADVLARLGEGPHTPLRLRPGDVVDERYRVIRALGEGGMGQVHEVERVSDRRRFALKVLTGDADRASLARFAREAQIAAELDHPNVVAALDVGVTREGTLFVVMELVAGASLAASRNRYGDAEWALPILAQLARAIAAMHTRGIVHRDLKPANVLAEGDVVRVTDFGLASLGLPLAVTIPAGGSLAAAVTSSLTKTGTVMGTPLYMAPELVHGARDAGACTDMFSAGVIAFELLAGRLPYTSPPVLARLAGHEPVAAESLARAVPAVPNEIADVVDRCLANAPEARPTASELAAALARYG